MSRVVLMCMLVILHVVTVACGSGQTVTGPTPEASVMGATAAVSPTSTPAPAPTATVATSGPGWTTVRRADMPNEWPLTVESGILRCQGQAVTFDSDGKHYAVNGTAKSRQAGIDIEEIWAMDSGGLGLRKNIGPLIQRGLALCS